MLELLPGRWQFFKRISALASNQFEIVCAMDQPTKGSRYSTAKLGPVPSLMRCRVLIADDDPLSRELLCDCLEPLGVDVVQARDGLEAIESIRHGVPHLLLVDIQMPRMDGFELLRQVRSNPATANVPVLAISAFAMAGDAERALARGFDQYITKPVALVELRKLVRRFLPSRSDHGMPFE